MVNTLLFVTCAVTLIAWLIQEFVARPQLQRNTLENAENPASASLEWLEPRIVPMWSEWLYRLVLTLWFAWLAAIIIIKDGDFALALVMVTLLSGVIAGLDRYVFQPRREAFLAQPPIDRLVNRFDETYHDRLATLLGSESAIAENGRSFFPVLALVLVLRSFLFEPFQIPSASMVPTLEVGDYILVNKFHYGLRLPAVGTKFYDMNDPKRGDVVVFFPPNDPRYFIKRLIGLPGDKIEYINKILFVNGEKADQQVFALLPPESPVVESAQEQLGPVSHLIHKNIINYGGCPLDKDMVAGENPGDFSTTVKPNHYFMMGDNRDNSSDSRCWGFVPADNIVGNAVAVWMHWGKFTELPSFDRVGGIK
jgi:signal peptidase I